MKIKELMTTSVEVLEPTETVEKAAQLMADADVGSVPVVENGRPVGILTDRDIVVRALAEGLPPKTKIEAVMTHQVVHCREDDDVDEVAAIMEDNQVRRIPVLNAGGELTGIVALADLATEGEGHALEVLERVSEPAGELTQGVHAGGPRRRKGPEKEEGEHGGES